MSLDNLAFIKEWKASNPSDTPLFFVITVGTLALVLWRGTKLALGEFILLFVLLLLALMQVRQQSWLAIVAPLILARHVAPSIRAEGAPMFLSAVSKRKWLGAAVFAGLLIVSVRLALPLQPNETMANPRTLLSRVPLALRSQPVFNGYSFGGPLILAGMEPYVDGRSDLYGDAFMADYVKITEGDLVRFDRAVRRYGITWTVLPPELQLTKALDASGVWRRVYADKIGVIHVRRAGPPVRK